MSNMYIGFLPQVRLNHAQLYDIRRWTTTRQQARQPDEMDEFLETYNLANLSEEEAENLN